MKSSWKVICTVYQNKGKRRKEKREKRRREKTMGEKGEKMCSYKYKNLKSICLNYWLKFFCMNYYLKYHQKLSMKCSN